MKYLIQTVTTICLLLFCITLVTGCGVKERSTSVLQQVKLVVANDDESTITYGDDYIQSTSGGMYVTNDSEYPVTLIMIRQDKGTIANDENEEFLFDLDGKETKLIESIDKNIPYEVGCRTSASEGTEIELTFKEYDE